MYDYSEKLLNLKEDSIFFIVRVDNEIYGKLFFVGSNKFHAKPNKTASMLLYLLARDGGDDIAYTTFVSLIGNKFVNIPGGAIDGFIDELKGLKILELKVSTELEEGVRDYESADPLHLFDSKEGTIDWAGFPPDLNVLDLKDFVIKKSHYYSKRPREGKMNGAVIRRP